MEGKKGVYFFVLWVDRFFATAPFYLQLLFPGSDLRFLRVLDYTNF